jgi:hypothetical protein
MGKDHPKRDCLLDLILRKQSVPSANEEETTALIFISIELLQLKINLYIYYLTWAKLNISEYNLSNLLYD